MYVAVYSCQKIVKLVNRIIFLILDNVSSSVNNETTDPAPSQSAQSERGSRFSWGSTSSRLMSFTGINRDQTADADECYEVCAFTDFSFHLPQVCFRPDKK